MTDHRFPYYITTAIPYVNSAPHVGFALELVLADALARHSRLQGLDVHFLSGTDDNSLKNVRAAELEGIPTNVFVERNARRFRELHAALSLSFDDFIQTSSDRRHAPGVDKLWRACEANGDLYRRSYRGLYCVGCEQFYTDSELLNGCCPDHGVPLETVEEENYFFKLSHYEATLLELLESERLRVEPEVYRRELISFVRSGLEDFSVSRSKERARGWAVPVPGDDGQVTYVWFDALGNYVTALDYAEEGPLWRCYWEGEGERVHVIGKGVTRFHAVYWPAILLSAGLALPNRILVHGYLTVDGHKISKSRTSGDEYDPAALARRFGADAVRYYLLRHSRAHQDTDFQVERLQALYRGELAGQLGNLVSRVLGLLNRKGDSLVPEYTEVPPRELRACAEALPGRINKALDDFRVHEALDAIWELVAVGNRYVEQTAPWSLTGDERANVLYNACELLRVVSVNLSPFLPTAAEQIRKALGLRELGRQGWGGLRPGTRLGETPILFPQLESSE